MSPPTVSVLSGLVFTIPSRLFVLSQCKLLGVNTPLVPLPTSSLFYVNEDCPVPPRSTDNIPDVMLLASCECDYNVVEIVISELPSKVYEPETAPLNEIVL